MAHCVKLASIAAAVVVSIATASPPVAWACGEELFRVGKGVSYREYQAPLPGNILMVARTSQERLVAEWLSHTGHNVQAVNDPAYLTSYLKRRRFDIILALFKDRDIVAAQVASAGSDAKYIPIAAANSSEGEVALGQYRQALTTDSTPRDLLKAIHRTLKSDSNRVTAS